MTSGRRRGPPVGSCSCGVLRDEVVRGQSRVRVPGTLRFGEAVLSPGDRAEADVELGRAIAVEPGMRFAMREGGAGVVSSVV